MKKYLLLVDFENTQRIDLSPLDESYRAIVFVGAAQSPPKAAKHPDTAHRFKRVEFQKILGGGRNALDFHIACHLGRTLETSPETVCIVVSGDKGYDALIQYLNAEGLECRRAESFDAVLADAVVICARCGCSRTIELHGGRWCANCGKFATPPDPSLLPSNQPDYREPVVQRFGRTHRQVCAWCNQMEDMSDGIYDDGEWMCGACISEYTR